MTTYECTLAKDSKWPTDPLRSTIYTAMHRVKGYPRLVQYYYVTHSLNIPLLSTLETHHNLTFIIFVEQKDNTRNIKYIIKQIFTSSHANILTDETREN